VAKHLGDALRADGGANVVSRPPNAAALDAMTSALSDDSVGVVYLGALSIPSLAPADSPPTLYRAMRACAECIELVKALDGVRGRFRNPPRLWLATRGAQGHDAAGPSDIVQTPLWGLGRTLALEYPDLWGGLIFPPMPVTERVQSSLSRS
jgi:hypothetical protein